MRRQAAACDRGGGDQARSFAERDDRRLQPASPGFEAIPLWGGREVRPSYLTHLDRSSDGNPRLVVEPSEIANLAGETAPMSS